MSKCNICTLNPKGTISFGHCVQEHSDCNKCVHKCTNEAFYVGGINVCGEHKEAFFNRIEEYWKDLKSYTKESLSWQADCILTLDARRKKSK